MELVQVHSLQEISGLPVNAFGIREPIGYTVSILNQSFPMDILIMPALGLTADGRRIGYGKGYYDNFLLTYDRWCKSNHFSLPWKIAVGLNCQLVPQLPVEAHDQKVDTVAIDSLLSMSN
jgi:5-formyltetrahydrofolate cyclo-ligase